MKDSFIVYTNIREIIDELNDEQVGQLFRAMVSYTENPNNPVGFEGVMKIAWIPIRQTLDINAEKYEKIVERNRKNGAKGGAPKKSVDEEEKPKQPSGHDNDNDNDIDNENERENDNESGKPDILSASSSLLSLLNDLAGTKYKTNDAEHLKLITALFKKGYTEEQIQRVIEKKCDEWLGDPKMEGYLRPKTLFKMSNFENYLEAPETARKKQKDEERAREKKKSDAKEKLTAAKKDLKKVQAELETINIKTDPDWFEKRCKLKEREAILLDFIERQKGATDD